MHGFDLDVLGKKCGGILNVWLRVQSALKADMVEDANSQFFQVRIKCCNSLGLRCCLVLNYYYLVTDDRTCAGGYSKKKRTVIKHFFA